MSVLILDVETTGLTEPRLVEAAWVKIDQGGFLTEKFYRRYCPGKPIEYGAMATHGITDDDVRDCFPASGFQLPKDTEYLIGHNIDYDYQVACACGPQPKPKLICTLALSRMLWPEVDSHKQLAMMYFFDRAKARTFHQKAHGAETDVLMTNLLLHEIRLKLNLREWDALWQASEKSRIPTHMTFGKHKGMKIADVPADYKRWLLAQPDVDPYLGKALRG